MRGKCRKICRNGLFIPNIRQHVIKDRHLRAFRRHRNSGLCRKRRQAHRFQRHRLASGVRPADHHHRFIATQRERQRHSLPPQRPQLRFQHGIARGIQTQRISRLEHRHHAINLASKSRARKYRIKMRHLRGRRGQCTTVRAQPLGQLRQNPRNFHQLFFGQLHQPVIQINRFQWLDEHRLPRRASPVHHAGYAAAIRSTHRNHETIIPQRDVILAARHAAGFAARPQNAFQRSPNRRAPLRNPRANPPQLRRSVVADFTIRQNRAANRGSQMPKICQRRRTPRKLRILCRISLKHLPQRIRNFQQRTRIQKFRNRQHGSGNRQPREPLLGIRKRPEAQLRPRAQISSRLPHQHEFRVEHRNIMLQCQCLDRSASGRTSRVPADNLFQLVKFQNLRS